jgi:hypothetical protein
MSRRRMLIAAWVLVLGLSAALPLSALFHGIVHFGPGSLREEQTATKPIISLGGDVNLPRGSKALVIAIFGDIRVSGTATDDLVTAGGGVYLEPHSRLRGDALTLAGGIYRASQVTTSGRLGGAVHSWDPKSGTHNHNTGRLMAANLRLGLAAGLALLLVGICLTIVFPWQIVLIATTLRDAPLKSLAAGITNLIIFVFLVVPLGLSLAGLPFAVLLTGAASLAWLFGLTASAVVIGRLLARGTVSLVWATAAGLLLVAFSLAVPLVGPLAVSAIGLAGTGALAVALLTRARPTVPMA